MKRPNIIPRVVLLVLTLTVALVSLSCESGGGMGGGGGAPTRRGRATGAPRVRAAPRRPRGVEWRVGRRHGRRGGRPDTLGRWNRCPARICRRSFLLGLTILSSPHSRAFRRARR